MTDLAKEVKCSPAYIGDVERGNRALTLANSNKWAKALNISHPELVQLLLQDMLDKARLRRLRVQVKTQQTTQLEDHEWDAVNEMVHSGWNQEDAIEEVVANR